MGIMVGIAVCVGNRRAVANAESEPTGIMTFADPAMQALCAKTWGDGTNITYEQAREVTEIPKNWARDNKVITSFNEIKYFKNLIYIRDAAFYGCTALTDINLDLPQCTSIGVSAFNKSAISCVVNLPNLETLGNHAFTSSKITKIISLGRITVIPSHEWESNQISEIGVFGYCKQLTSVNLPQTLAKIGNLAFYGCTALTDINLDLPQCKSIGTSAFNKSAISCVVNLPNLEALGNHAFTSTKITKIISLGKITVIPSHEWESNQISEIGVFGNCKQLTSVNLPPTLVKIGNIAFYGCTALTDINLDLPQCTSIGNSAFNGCSSMALTSLVLPQCTSIGTEAFHSCSSMALTSLDLPQCTSIGGSAFESCSKMALTSLELPQCTSIGGSAFNGCSSMALTSLDLPQCTSIGGSAFRGCSSMALTSLDLPQCTSIGDNAFRGCSSMALTSLVLPQCTSIGTEAFKSCSSMALTSLDLPQCTSIGNECFAYTKGIGKLNWGELAKNVVNEGFRNIKGIGIPIVNIPNVTAWFESTFGYVNASPAIYSHNLCQNDVPMPDVVIPEGCTKVGQKTLCYLHLNSLSIPETVTSIGDYNQYALQLPVFDIPSSVTEIGQYVIGGNYDSNVKNVPIVICRATTPPRLGTVKANNGAHQAIYVPDESVEAYKTATNWSAFADIILPLSQYNG